MTKRQYDHAARMRVEAARHNPNVEAFLRVIRHGESSQDEGAFFLRWGGTGQKPKRFTDTSDHPRILEPGPNGPSSAAGAFQETMTTFDDVAPIIGVTDFTPESQTLIAIGVIDIEDALDDVIAGRLRDALAKCAGRWASFPDSRAGQRTHRYDELERVFLRYGGTIDAGVAAPPRIDPDTQPAAPIEERDLSGIAPREGGFMDSIKDWFGGAASVAGQAASTAAPLVGVVNPGIGLALGLAGELIKCFEPLAREKVTKELARHTDPQIAAQVADNMLAKAKALARTDDPVTAVATVKANAEMIAEVQADVIDDLQRFAPMLAALGAEDDRVAKRTIESMDAAAARNAGTPNDQDPYLTRAVVRMMYGITAALGAGIVALYWQKGAIPGELLTIFAGLVGIIGTKFSTRIDHRYGSAHQSTATGVIQSRLK